MKKIVNQGPKEAPKFATWYNYHEVPKQIKAEKLNPISLTVPGQAFSIREILEKFTRGMSFDNIAKQPQFMDNPDFDSYDFTTSPDFDLADVTNHKAAIEAAIENAKLAKGADPGELARVKTAASSEPAESSSGRLETGQKPGV